jgi:hypothetical protein
MYVQLLRRMPADEAGSAVFDFDARPMRLSCGVPRLVSQAALLEEQRWTTVRAGRWTAWWRFRLAFTEDRLQGFPLARPRSGSSA